MSKWLSLLLCLVLALSLCACEGEPAGNEDVFPTWANTYTVADFENIRFRCTVSWEDADGTAHEIECSKEDSVVLYNLMNRGEWTAPTEESRTGTIRPILTFEFSTGDISKAKNCYGMVSFSDQNAVVFTPSAVLGSLTPYVAPEGTYAALWDKVQSIGEK